MTYNEWRDELKNNLLSVSDAERRRVLDYYAEAYADRREAGFSEREIIDDFGAPYDAAQRILNENIDDEESAPKASPPPRREEIRTGGSSSKCADNTPSKAEKSENYGWLFVVLCIIFCIPLFGIIMGLVGITIGLCVAPFALIVSGSASIVGSIIQTVGGNVAYGFYMLGCGFIEIGAGIILLPLFKKIIQLIWKAFNKIITAIKNAFTGKEKTA